MLSPLHARSEVRVGVAVRRTLSGGTMDAAEVRERRRNAVRLARCAQDWCRGSERSHSKPLGADWPATST